MLLAYRLRERGIACCVLEADAVGSGTTGGSTGKVTAQHGLIYAKLLSEFGRTKAKEYAQSNAAAVEEYAYLVEKEGIACDFTRCSAYVYSRDGMAALRDEAEAARRLGLNAVLSEVTKLPFPVDGALCFPDQARFDPLAFARGLAKRAEEMGATIFEQTRVTGVEDMRVLTAEGTMQAKHVVFACHYPIINIPGYYFLRMSQQRPLPLRCAAHRRFQARISMRSRGRFLFAAHAFRMRMRSSLQPMMCAAEKNTAGGKYRELLCVARKFYPECELIAQWSAQDCRTADEVPYIRPV